MRRAVVVSILVFSLLALSVSAADFDVTVFPHERTIKLNESATFEVELKNQLPVDGVFEVYSNDVTWDVRTEKPLRVSASKTLKTNLIVRPLNLNPGAYNIPINFKRVGGGEVQRSVLYIELLSPFPSDATYLPAVKGVGTIDKQVDPREDVVMKLSLENQNRRDLGQVEVKVRSKVINKDYSTSLGALEKKTLTFTAQVDAKTPPQSDLLQVSIIVPEGEKAYQFDLFPLPYEVMPYGAVVPRIETADSFLKKIENVSLVNEGNQVLTYSYKVSRGLKGLFMSAIPDYEKKEGSYVWTVTLGPGETARVIVMYNYRPILWTALLAIVLLGVYFYFRSPIKVTKRAVILTSHEGGIAEVKVLVELVNRSKKNAHDVSVIDLLPPLSDVVREFKDTLAPSKITPHQEQGTLIKWDIAAMEPKEHRILVYRMRTKLSVLGGMTLPVTAVTFFVDGAQRETVSNKANLRQ